MKAKTPEKLKSPMRVLLFQHLIQTVQQKFKLMVASSSSRSTVASVGWMNAEETAINGVRLDAEHRTHIKDLMIPPHTIAEVREAVEETTVKCTKPPEAGFGISIAHPHHAPRGGLEGRSGAGCVEKIASAAEICSLGRSTRQCIAVPWDSDLQPSSSEDVAIGRQGKRLLLQCDIEVHHVCLHFPRRAGASFQWGTVEVSATNRSTDGDHSSVEPTNLAGDDDRMARAIETARRGRVSSIPASRAAPHCRCADNKLASPCCEMACT